MSSEIRIALSALQLEARERVRGYCSKVANVEVVPKGETFIVIVTDYGKSLRSMANLAALYAQSDLRRLFRLD
jgi:hypothetical protein